MQGRQNEGAQKAPQKDPHHYPGGSYSDSSQGHVDTAQNVPSVPKVVTSSQSGSGKTSVDTSSLKMFADNLDTLADILKGARTRVENLQAISAGTFNEAKALAQAVTGNSGLQPSYVKSIHLLREALMDTANSIRSLATKYSTIEEINHKAGKDISELIQTAEGEIKALESGLQTQKSGAAPG